MATKSIVLKREYKTRRDRKVQEYLQKCLEIVIDHLYEDGYLDPENDIVEARITVKTREEDVSSHLS